MAVLTLPRLVAGRELASTMIRSLGSLEDADVVVDARNTVSGTSSFAAGLVRDALVGGRAARLTIVGAPDDFNDYARDAAQALDVTSRLDLSGTMPGTLSRV